MAVAFRSVSHGTVISSDDITVNAPAGIQEGDILIAWGICRSNDFDAVPEGFVSIGATIYRLNGNMHAYYKVATDSEPATYAFSGNGAVSIGASIAAYSGVDPVDPINAFAFASELPAGSPFNTQVTTDVDNCGIVVLAAAGTGGAMTFPEQTERSESGAASHELAIADEIGTVAGVYTGSWTTDAPLSGTHNHSIGMIALNPLIETDPPVVDTLAAELTGPARAMLNGTVDDAGADADWHFEIGLDDTYGTTVPGGTVPAESGVTPVESEVSGLALATTYHYRVVATNSEGTANGDDVTFVTDDRPDNRYGKLAGGLLS